MGIWGKVRERMIKDRGMEEADKVMTAEQARELDAALAADAAFTRRASAQYEKDIGLDRVRKLLGEPDKPTEWAGAKS